MVSLDKVLMIPEPLRALVANRFKDDIYFRQRASAQLGRNEVPVKEDLKRPRIERIRTDKVTENIRHHRALKLVRVQILHPSRNRYLKHRAHGFADENARQDDHLRPNHESIHRQRRRRRRVMSTLDAQFSSKFILNRVRELLKPAAVGSRGTKPDGDASSVAQTRKVLTRIRRRDGARVHREDVRGRDGGENDRGCDDVAARAGRRRRHGVDGVGFWRAGSCDPFHSQRSRGKDDVRF